MFDGDHRQQYVFAPYAALMVAKMTTVSFMLSGVLAVVDCRRRTMLHIGEFYTTYLSERPLQSMPWGVYSNAVISLIECGAFQLK